MHKAGEWCLSPCTGHGAGRRGRRNDEFRPLLHSLARGATNPPATLNDSLPAAPGFLLLRGGCSARGNPDWSHCSHPAPCAEPPTPGIPRVPEPLLRSSFTPEQRHSTGTPAPGRVCLGVSPASDMRLGRTQPSITGRALGNPTAPCSQQGMVCCGAMSTATAASCGPHAILNGVRSCQQGTLSLCGLLAAWAAELLTAAGDACWGTNGWWDTTSQLLG